MSSESDSRDVFKRIFNQHFLSNVNQGMGKNEAAAAALTSAQAFVSSSSGSSSLPPPPAGQNKEVKEVVKKEVKQEVNRKREEVRVSVSIMKQLVEQCKADSSFTPIIRLVGEVFSSPEKLAVCFAPRNSHFSISTSHDDKMDVEDKEESSSTNENGENENEDSMDVAGSGAPEANNRNRKVEVQEEEEDGGDGIKVDLRDVREVFSLLQSCQSHSEGVGNSLFHALESLSYQLLSSASSCRHPEDLKVYMILMEHPSLLEYTQASRNLLQAMDKLPSSSRSLLQQCLKENALKLTGEEDTESVLPGSSDFSIGRLNHYVNFFREFISQRIQGGSVQEMRYAVRALSLVHNALYEEVSKEDEKEDIHTAVVVRSSGPHLPSNTFYMEQLCDLYMSTSDGRKREYKLWRVDLAEMARAKEESNKNQNSNASQEYQCQSVISFPYVLTPATKAEVLELDANVEMRQIVSAEYDLAVASGSRYMIPYLVMRIRRGHVIEDTLNHFVAHSDSDYKKPLKVVFDNEEGIDEGGVRKEYYQIMMKQLLDPNYGMFKYYEESRLLWFNSDSFESELEFELIGVLLGVAIYNAIIVDFQMPKVIYKKLMGEPATLNDLRELQPDLAKGLDQILDCGDATAFDEMYGDMTFQMTYETLGERRAIDLKPGGEATPVTFETREEYVSLYVSYLLDVSVQSQFNAFAKGFRKVCGGAALDLFNAEELELLICGNPVLDFHELEAGTRYQDGYSGEEEVVAYFWETLHSFSEEEKRGFLKFMSGSDRSPIDGLSKMNFVISRNGDDESRLPSAHTCFNHMLLPQYSTKEILRERLLYAIGNAAEGFGLI